MSLEGKATPGQELKGRINAIDILTISAYGIAVKHGFEGTEEEWLDSLALSDLEIEQAVSKYLKENPVAIDTTLSVSGEAADAKVTGDALTKLEGDIEAAVKASETADAELMSEITAVSNATTAAQNTADTAVADAATAQNTADTAVVNAAAAQTAATEARSYANTANSKATTASTDAARALTKANSTDRKWAGCWIEFTDENGNPTDEPYIHWNEG